MVMSLGHKGLSVIIELDGMNKTALYAHLKRILKEHPELSKTGWKELS